MDRTSTSGTTLLARALSKLRGIADEHGLTGAPVAVRARPLTPTQAIGRPERDDYPILRGRERVISARVLDGTGQAYTSAQLDWDGTLGEVLERSLDTDADRALVVATMNAVCAHLGLVTDTLHCRDDGPARCAGAVAREVRERFGDVDVGLVGLQPGIAAALAEVLGPGRLRIADIDPENVGTTFEGAPVLDGAREMETLVARSRVLLVTGSTIVNGTLDGIVELADKHARTYLVYGVTIAGPARLLGLDRLCFEAGPGCAQGR